MQMLWRRILQWVRSVAYEVGLLGGIHRLRNKRCLTVFMFHRVLPSHSQEFCRAEREFTMSVEGFERTLEFIRRHYNVIGMADVMRAINERALLPDRAALITFDDGWRDTLIYAWPALRKRELPALMFVPSSVPASTSDRWWHDALVEVLKLPGTAQTFWAELDRAGLVSQHTQRTDGELIAVFAEMPEAKCIEWISRLLTIGELPRQMIDHGELMSAQAQGLDIGAHGHTHAPLTAVADPSFEISQSVHMLQCLRGGGHGPNGLAMSFPHGAWNPKLHESARNFGFDLVFTSAPYLVNSDAPSLSSLAFGRIHIPENEWTCDGGRISFPRLATFLFFRPTLESNEVL